MLPHVRPSLWNKLIVHLSPIHPPCLHSAGAGGVFIQTGTTPPEFTLTPPHPKKKCLKGWKKAFPVGLIWQRALHLLLLPQPSTQSPPPSSPAPNEPHPITSPSNINAACPSTAAPQTQWYTFSTAQPSHELFTQTGTWTCLCQTHHHHHHSSSPPSFLRSLSTGGWHLISLLS